MKTNITGQLEEIQRLLDQADRHPRTEAQIGSLILAVQTLAEIVEAQAKRINDLELIQNERAED